MPFVLHWQVWLPPLMTWAKNQEHGAEILTALLLNSSSCQATHCQPVQAGQG